MSSASHPAPTIDPSPRALGDCVPLSLRLGLILAWVGALISLLLLREHAGVRSFLCPIQGGCETVLASRFASVRGIPLPFLGAAFYLVVLALLLGVYSIREKIWRRRLLDSALWMTVVGLTFSAGLMYLQFGVLHAFCPLCTSSALVMAGLLAATARAGKNMTTGDWGHSPGGAITLGIFAILPAALLLVSGFVAPAPGKQTQWIDLSTARLAGPREARVQLVVFSDFQCAFCQQLAPVVKRIRDEFPDSVLVAFRYFPLESHPRAIPAAIAAECAADQGAFWPYHDKLFAEGGDLEEAQFLALAASLGLDQERFTQCLRSEAPQKRVAASREDAIKAGLEGVPAVFINGKRVQSALDYEHLTREIRTWLPASPDQASSTSRK